MRKVAAGEATAAAEGAAAGGVTGAAAGGAAGPVTVCGSPPALEGTGEVGAVAPDASGVCIAGDVLAPVTVGSAGS